MLTAEYEIQKKEEEKEKAAELKVNIPVVVSSVSRAAKDKSAAKPWVPFSVCFIFMGSSLV